MYLELGKAHHRSNLFSYGNLGIANALTLDHKAERRSRRAFGCWRSRLDPNTPTRIEAMIAGWRAERLPIYKSPSDLRTNDFYITCGRYWDRTSDP